MERIYLDSNATTPMLPAVWEAMRPYLDGIAGNPASAHQEGRQARRALDDAREQVAQLLGAHPDEVIFTSGATEANNLALPGLAGEPPGHLLVSPIEHPSVSEPIRQLEQRGFRRSDIPVSREGVAQIEEINALLHPETRLVALMRANHETGALQPVRELAERLPAEVALHCDAVQAVGKIPVHFHELGVATLSLSAHKFHGPKGVGALLINRCTHLRPALWGGHQQRGIRPGTEPVALVVGLARALALAVEEMRIRTMRIEALRRRFLEVLRQQAAPVVLNGPENSGVPHTMNLSFPGVHADVLLIKLDLVGVACSTGSACSSGSLLPSPVLTAMRVPVELLRSAMRFSLNALLTVEQVEEAAQRIARAVQRLRSADEEMLPLLPGATS